MLKEYIIFKTEIKKDKFKTERVIRERRLFSSDDNFTELVLERFKKTLVMFTEVLYLYRVDEMGVFTKLKTK